MSDFYSTVYYANGTPSPISDVKEAVGGVNDFMGFIAKVKEVGLFEAIYDKPFPVVLGEFVVMGLKEIGTLIVENGDLFFLLPAIAFMAITFIVGKNKFAKWILPLWFLYFITRMFLMMLN